MARLVIAAALLLAVGASASLVLLPPKLGESEPSGGSWAQHSCSGTAEACSLAALTPGALNIITPVDAPPCARGAPFRFQVRAVRPGAAPQRADGQLLVAAVRRRCCREATPAS